VAFRKPARRVSVKDVAARAGVSFQTTSKVLNGGGTVSEVTRARIHQVASDLGYVPNLQARSLVMQRTRTVGLLAGDFSDPNLSRFIVGAEREARRQGYGVLMTSIDLEVSGTEYALPALMERRVDGILLAAPQMEGDRAVARALDKTVPVVSLHQIPGGGVAAVGTDDEQIGLLATRHLVAKGHRVIATVIGPRARRVTQARLRGYQKALDEAGLRFDERLVVEGSMDAVAAGLATAQLLPRAPEVTAIFAQNDYMAVGVLRALRESGTRVPQDCAVIGCDDIEMAAFTIPPLTTIHVPFFETGAQAMRLLVEMINNGAVAPRKLVLPVHLVSREST